MQDLCRVGDRPVGKISVRMHRRRQASPVGRIDWLAHAGGAVLPFVGVKILSLDVVK